MYFCTEAGTPQRSLDGKRKACPIFFQKPPKGIWTANFRVGCPRASMGCKAWSVTAWAKFMTSIVYYVAGVCCHLHNNLPGRCPVNNKEGGSVMSKVILVAAEAEVPD